MIKMRFFNKYHAIRSGGFGSKLESAVYQILKLREKAGEIKDIRCQHSVDLGFQITWKVDFSYLAMCPTNPVPFARVFVEAKGIETRDYRLMLKLWRWGQGPGNLEIWKGSYRGPTLTEIVVPRKLK